MDRLSEIGKTMESTFGSLKFDGLSQLGLGVTGCIDDNNTLKGCGIINKEIGNYYCPSIK